jgi:hypothetical protein
MLYNSANLTQPLLMQANNSTPNTTLQAHKSQLMSITNQKIDDIDDI